MELTYRRATLDDIEILTRTRIKVLRAANSLDDSADMSAVERQSRDYYIDALKNGTHLAYLVFEDGRFAGSGGVSFYTVMPTFHNPSGQKAYIMNMYTEPDYRRRGIAYKVLDLLVSVSRERNVSFITLEATNMGKPLYKKYGFVTMRDEMKLPSD